MNARLHLIPQRRPSVQAFPWTSVVAASLILIPLAVMSGCTDSMPGGMDPGAAADEGAFERGPNNGRMLRNGDFAIELAVFEAGRTAGIPRLGHAGRPRAGSP